MQIEDLNNRFGYHPPQDDATIRAHENVRAWCLSLAELINDTVPEGREKSLAITHLEDVMMWSNAALARESSKPGSSFSDSGPSDATSRAAYAALTSDGVRS